ncbi:hypothetical protein B0H14DRAFT_3431064 [Mycena olivaceomarginata]|nr:hypothetical protein B0H14DRAFT_3431064 [Mycena olivaceomarginata]
MASSKRPAFPNFSACLLQPLVYSCKNTAQIANMCCSPMPGGVMLQTQFWSTWTDLKKWGQRPLLAVCVLWAEGLAVPAGTAIPPAVQAALDS